MLSRRNAAHVDNATFDADLRALLAALRALPSRGADAGRAATTPRAAEGQSLTLTFLFTDIVGSTDLLQRLGEEKAQQLFGRHHVALAKAVTEFGGTELEWLGDGIVASFASSAEAIRCALAMQRATRRPIGGQTVAIRIGVHTGEAMRRAGGFFGNTVVIARRLCDRAVAGQVLTSGFVASMLGGRALEFRSIGPLELKGIATPVDAFEVFSGRSAPVASPSPAVVPALTPAVVTPPRVASTARPLPRWALLGGGVGLGALALVAAVVFLPGFLGGGPPTGRAPLINAGTGVVTFGVGGSACEASRNCFIFLLDAVSDPDGDPVTLDSVGSSQQGASVSVAISGGRPVAHWSAPAGFTATSDSFQFTVSDNHHNVVHGTCEVFNIPVP
jgi:class 3 adenylate cyclase